MGIHSLSRLVFTSDGGVVAIVIRSRVIRSSTKQPDGVKVGSGRMNQSQYSIPGPVPDWFILIYASNSHSLVSNGK